MSLARLSSALFVLTLVVAAAAPRPELTPGDVVRIQLRALQNNDEPYPDAGIATAFAFASERNREQTGPLKRFARVLHESYAEMLNHREARFSPAVIHGDDALQAVELTARDGRTWRYVFILSRSGTPGCARCWLTEGVVSRGPPPGPAEYAL